MEKITLKLTSNENMFLHIMTDIDHLNQGWVEEYVFLCKDSAERIDIDISNNEYIIQDADKFREFLNDEMDSSDRFACSILKSILSKLDKAN